MNTQSFIEKSAQNNDEICYDNVINDMQSYFFF